VRPFFAVLDRPGGIDAAAFRAGLDRAAGLGYTEVKVTLTWAKAQPKGPGPVDFSSVDQLVAAVRVKGLAPALVIDHAAPPPWVDVNEYGMRDLKGNPILSATGGHPLLMNNALQVAEWVGAVFKAAAGHFRDTVAFYQDFGQHQKESATRRPASLALDHSPRCAQAYRTWLKNKYLDVRTLNAAWETDFKAWDEIPAGEGTRKPLQADFHLFRYSTLASWAAHIRKMTHEGHAGAVYAFRTGTTRMESNLVQLGFDLGRYARACDLLLAEESTDLFTMAMIRTAAELAGLGRPEHAEGLSGSTWAMEAVPAGAPAGGGGEGAEQEAVGWGKHVYDQGGFLTIRQPLEHAAGKALEHDVVKLLPMPPPPPRNNRHAVYVSAAEAQFWDGTDLEATHALFSAQTDGGKKTTLDVISDGMFTGAPDVLRRYTAGIEVPFAKCIAKDARSALTQAAKSGIRITCRNASIAGTQDEHGKLQPPLAG